MREQRTHAVARDAAYYEDRARGLLEVLPDGAPSTIRQVRTWHPAFADRSDEEIRLARFGIDDARLVYARQHGFESWERFMRHVQSLAAGEAREPFLELLEAGRSRDWPSATAILGAHPELVRAPGTNGNTLLNLASSLVACPAADSISAPDGTEERLAPLELLLAAGADPNQANERGWTPLHQAGYRNDPAMAALLLRAGARVEVEAHGSGGTPLAVALFWGHREASAVLAAEDVVPNNLRIAAGLGRVDLAEACFTADGRLTERAGAERGFYRPHSGFPRWRPTDDAQQVLDEALVWAAKAGRVESMSLLVDRGANVAADPYRGTPLLWAAANARREAILWLLDHGAAVSQRATFGGEQHGKGVTALHLAAQNGDLATARLLVEQRADAGVEDELYHSTPAGWAEHAGATDVASFLRAL